MTEQFDVNQDLSIDDEQAENVLGGRRKPRRPPRTARRWLALTFVSFGLMLVPAATAATSTNWSPGANAGTLQTTFNWTENQRLGGKPLVRLQTRELTVGDSSHLYSWVLSASITNISGVTITCGCGLGLAFYPSASANVNQPSVYRTQSLIQPAPPHTLPPGRSWLGVVAGKGSLPSSGIVRIIFGPYTRPGAKAASFATSHYLAAPPSSGQTGAITGVVRWPDGTVAKNAPITIFPIGYTAIDNTPYATVVTDANGVYSSNVCLVRPCGNVQAYFDLASAAYSQATGAAIGCDVIMTSPSGPISGFSIAPGARVDWQMQSLPCSDGMEPFTSSYLNPVDQRGTLPPWTTARSILGG